MIMNQVYRYNEPILTLKKKGEKNTVLNKKSVI